MSRLLLGYETEYGVAAAGSHPGAAAERLLSAFRRLPHLNFRGGGGMFLTNGSRVYVDCCHPEIATAESDDPFEAVSLLLAGDEWLRRLASEVTPRAEDLRIFKSNVDYFSGVTFASHESYSHRCSPRSLPRHLLPFLVSRVALAGAGGIQLNGGIEFVLSPRVAFLEHDVSPNSTAERGIFHTKDESLAKPGWHRLHVLCAESLCSHRANLVRIGSTGLVVTLIDYGLMPREPLSFEGSALAALRTFNGDPWLRTRVRMADGRDLTALDIQRIYLEAVQKHLESRRLPSWTDGVCRLWRETLDWAQSGPERVATSLDWAIKFMLYTEHSLRRGFSMEEIANWNQRLALAGTLVGHPPLNPRTLAVPDEAEPPFRYLIRKIRATSKATLASLDIDLPRLELFLKLRSELCELELRFGELRQGLFYQLDRRGLLAHQLCQITPERIQRAMDSPPTRGRAHLRGELVRQLARHPQRYFCDWQGILDVEQARHLDLSDPYAEEAQWTDVPINELHREGDGISHSIVIRMLAEAENAFNSGDYDRAASLLAMGDRYLVALAPELDAHWSELWAFSEARRGEVTRARRACARLVRILGRTTFKLCSSVVSTLRFCGLVPPANMRVWLARGAKLLSEPAQAGEIDDYSRFAFTYHYARALTVQGTLSKARELLAPMIGNTELAAAHPRTVARARCDYADILRRLGTTTEAREQLRMAMDSHRHHGQQCDLADHALAGMAKTGNEREARQALDEARQIQIGLNLRMGYARSLCLTARRFPKDESTPSALNLLRDLKDRTPALQRCRVFNAILDNWNGWLAGDPHPQIDDIYWGL